MIEHFKRLNRILGLNTLGMIVIGPVVMFTAFCLWSFEAMFVKPKDRINYRG